MIEGMRQDTSDTPAAAPSSPLYAALGLDGGPHPAVVAVVGGGGKTSLVYRLAREAAGDGRRAIVAGTTRFTRPQAPERMPPLVAAPLEHLPDRVREAWEEPDAPGVVVAAGDEPQPAGRLAPLDGPTVERLARLPGIDLIVLEADGSKLRPFKAPAEHEPVIPACATHVVAVVGLDALDMPLVDEYVHRPDRVRAILQRAGVVSTQCSAAVIATVLASQEGGRKFVEDRPFVVVVNKAELDPPRAELLGRHILEAGASRVVLTSLRAAGHPVRATLGR